MVAVASFAVGAVSMNALRDAKPSLLSQSGPVVSSTLPVQPRLVTELAPTENLPGLRALDSSFRNLAKFVSPAVVDIKATRDRAMDEMGRRLAPASGEGSGFIIREDGWIVTNDHVVGTSDKVQVTLKDGRVLEGKVTRGGDRNNDVALVKVDAKDLPFLTFADSSQVEPGQFAVAIGAPFGLESSVTIGHVSALKRNTQIGGMSDTRVYTDLIQTDASINMGNSGGPLVNVDGQVIGMNTAIYSPTGGSNGIGFAITSNQVKLIADILMSKGKLVRSMLGVIPEDLKEFERVGAKAKFPEGGARVSDVVGDPGKTAGLQKGDIITKIGSNPVKGQLDLRNSMLQYAPGSTVKLEVLREGKKLTLDAKLLEYKDPVQPTAPVRQPGGNGQRYRLDPFDDFPDFQNRLREQFPNLRTPKSELPKEDSEVQRVGPPQLGVQIQPVDESARNQFRIPAGVQGVVIIGFGESSIAKKYGYKVGDVITHLNDKPLTSPDQLRDTIRGLKWGDSVRLRSVRFEDKSRIEISRDVKLG